jgi:hypothetical protein
MMIFAGLSTAWRGECLRSIAAFSPFEPTCNQLSLSAHQAERVLQLTQQAHASNCIVTSLLQVGDLPLQDNGTRATFRDMPVGFLQEPLLVQYRHVQYLTSPMRAEIRGPGGPQTQSRFPSIRHRSS